MGSVTPYCLCCIIIIIIHKSFALLLMGLTPTVGMTVLWARVESHAAFFCVVLPEGVSSHHMASFTLWASKMGRRVSIMGNKYKLSDGGCMCSSPCMFLLESHHHHSIPPFFIWITLYCYILNFTSLGRNQGRGIKRGPRKTLPL